MYVDPTWKYIVIDNSEMYFQTKILNGFNRFPKLLFFFFLNTYCFFFLILIFFSIGRGSPKQMKKCVTAKTTNNYADCVKQDLSVTNSLQLRRQRAGPAQGTCDTRGRTGRQLFRTFIYINIDIGAGIFKILLKKDGI